MTTGTRLPEPMLEVRALRHRYAADSPTVLHAVDLDVADGEVVAIVGPSGCGKTTVLRVVAGLMRPTGGGIRLAGRVVDGVPEDMAVVFQDYSRSLFPWMTVERNIDFGLTNRRLSRAERAERTTESLRAVGLLDARHGYPWQLSGGMQQRVAIARALAYRPRLLLMDEPFASVDAQTREDLEDLVLAIREQFAVTILVVTHDIDESVYLGDRVVVLSAAPATVLASIAVPIHHPREHIATKAGAAFVGIRAEVARMVRDAALGRRPTVHR